MIAGLSLERRIFLLSALPHDELWSLYKGALFFVMLSRMAEGLPLVFFEAMACGIPVIGSRNGGTPEVVLHGETGLLVEDNEPGTVAEAMRQLLANSDKREKLGRRGYECAKHYDWQQTASLYVQLYHDILGAQR
jgi:glycosyltransferase involved in cell wall biosynthesis